MGLVQMKHSWGMWSSKPQRKPFKVASEKRISDFVPVMHPLLVLFNVTMQLGSVGILARGWVEDKGCDFLWVGWRESWLQQPHQIRLIWSGIATLRVILASTVNTWISSNYNEERGKRVLHIVRFRCLCSTPTYVKLVQCKSVKWWLAKFITLPARLCYVFMNNAFSPIWSGVFVAGMCKWTMNVWNTYSDVVDLLILVFHTWYFTDFFFGYTADN